MDPLNRPVRFDFRWGDSFETTWNGPLGALEIGWRAFHGLDEEELQPMTYIRHRCLQARLLVQDRTPVVY